MTLVRVLPNRYIVLLMTPREASMLEGQILDPSEWPWQDTEAHMVGQDVKWKLHEAVGNIAAMELDKSLIAIEQMAEAQRREEERREQEEEEAPPEPPLQVTEAPEEDEGGDGHAQVSRAVPQDRRFLAEEQGRQLREPRPGDQDREGSPEGEPQRPDLPSHRRRQLRLRRLGWILRSIHVHRQQPAGGNCNG